MYEHKVGKVYETAIGHQEGCFFDIDDSGASMIIYFESPTQKEKEQMSSNKAFELRFIQMSNVLLFLAKFGSLNWMDMPYNPHLSTNLSEIGMEPGKGLALTIMLFDTKTGILEHIRFVSLSERFTEKIKKNVEELLCKPFDKSEYRERINMIFLRYSTNQLVKMSEQGFKIS